MVQNSFISLISQEEKEENRGSVEFQVFSWTNKIRRLTPHLELHRKDFPLKEFSVKFWENVNDCCLICQRKREYFINT